MKANEAPDKIYITPHFERRWFTKEIDDVSVEYIRSDAFIDKAKEAFCKATCKEFANFVKFMKGEEV